METQRFLSTYPWVKTELSQDGREVRGREGRLQRGGLPAQPPPGDGRGRRGREREVRAKPAPYGCQEDLKGERGRFLKSQMCISTLALKERSSVSEPRIRSQKVFRFVLLQGPLPRKMGRVPGAGGALDLQDKGVCKCVGDGERHSRLPPELLPGLKRSSPRCVREQTDHKTNWPSCKHVTEFQPPLPPFPPPSPLSSTQGRPKSAPV